MRVAVPQLAKPCAGQPVQGPPEDFVEKPPDIEPHPAGVGLGLDDVYGVRRLGGKPGAGFDHLRSAQLDTWSAWKTQSGRLKKI